jgi:hypothetical protein
MAGFLDRLEQRTYRAYWSDGLLDLLAGAALVAIGVGWLCDGVVFGAIAPALLVPLWAPLRKRFTVPRLGHVEFASSREARNQAFLSLMLWAGVLSFLLGVGIYFTRGADLGRWVVHAFPGAMIGVGAIATARALGLRRFFVYGAISIGAGALVGLGAGVNPGWSFLVTGISALLGGGVLATRFVARHPRNGGEA